MEFTDLRKKTAENGRKNQKWSSVGNIRQQLSMMTLQTRPILVKLFLLTFCFKTRRSRFRRTFSPFDPKSRNMTPLKSHFLKGFSPDFAEFWCEDVKLMRIKYASSVSMFVFVFYLLRKFAGEGEYDIRHTHINTQ